MTQLSTLLIGIMNGHAKHAADDISSIPKTNNACVMTALGELIFESRAVPSEVGEYE